MAVLEVGNRKPVEIIEIQYAFLHFESEGRIDAPEEERKARLALEVLPAIAEGRDHSKVIDARHRWSPNPEIKAPNVKAIFGKQ
jgi:hypothetical protein